MERVRKAEVLAPSKFNCGKKPNAISYRINEVNGFPVVEWVGESELTATQLLGQFEQKSRAAEARDYILDALGVGPVWRAELWEEFASFHASDDERERQALEKVFERAFTKLRKKPNKMVESLSCGRQGSIWRLWDADPAADRFHRDAAEKLRYHGGGELFEQVSPPT